MARYLVSLLFAILTFSAAAGKGSRDPWTGWFQRVADQMDLRAFGATAFHMKVTFHAFPGIVLSKKEEDQILSGDGTYEEIWIAPHKWRREVAFGSYHAVEVESELGRKMQASSDYEPSRVLMLLEALLHPIPRDLSSPSLAEEHPWWRIENGAVSSQSYVKISRTDVPKIMDKPGGTPGVHAYLFLPSGELLQSIELGIVTDWTGARVFNGRLVPQHIQIQGGNQQDLLAADVTVDPSGQVDAAAFTLPGVLAEPGMTLRPLHWYECEGWKVTSSYRFLMSGPDDAFHGIIRRILDRHGVSREVEVIYAPNPDSAQPLLPLVRKDTFRPITIDKNPCEFVLRLQT